MRFLILIITVIVFNSLSFGQGFGYVERGAESQVNWAEDAKLVCIFKSPNKFNLLNKSL